MIWIPGITLLQVGIDQLYALEVPGQGHNFGQDPRGGLGSHSSFSKLDRRRHRPPRHASLPRSHRVVDSAGQRACKPPPESSSLHSPYF